MGRLIGKRPDATAAIAKAIRGHLQPGEQVLAGVYVQRPGTTNAQAAGGSSAGIAGALGTGPTFRHGRDGTDERWLAQTAALGLEVDVARRSVFLSLALTTSRLLLVRRSRLTRRPREAIAAWPIPELDGIAVPRNGSTLVIRRAADELILELPQAHRFLPQVYRDIPELFRRTAESMSPSAC